MNDLNEIVEKGIVDRVVDGLFILILDHHHRHLSEMELTLPQAQALRLLRGAPVSTSNLALSLGISPPAVSQLTDRLVRKHLIQRRAGERDRRAVTVELSEKGKRLIDGLRVRRNSVFGEVLLRLTEEDRKGVIESLDKLVRVLPADTIRGQTPDGASTKRTRARIQREPRRTADQPPITSNIVEEVQAVTPKPKRMRIEWD